MMRSLAEAKILVTGATDGLGKSVALELAERGATVLLHGRNPQRCEAALEEIRRETGSEKLRFYLADFSSLEEVRGLAERVLSEHDRLDVLVNNAGIFEPHAITDSTYEEWQRGWERTLAVNLIGPANACWCAVRHMLRSGGGRIVNVSSRGAFRGEPGHPAYGASKAGLIALGQSLARALGPHGIAVTAVAPGFTETDMAAEALAGEQGVARRAESPLGRVATAEEVAAAVLFLASPEAELTSGTVLDVNGASYLRM